jgi:hypothetical protein
MRGLGTNAIASLLLLASFSAGCDFSRSSNIPSGPTAPTPPPPTAGIATFSGTFTQGDHTVHQFFTSAQGTLTITLVTVSEETIALGVGLGVFNGLACSVQASALEAHQGDSFQANAGGAGSYCLTMFDVGAIGFGELVSYEVTVDHP